ncbi:MAG: hypothetical protein QF918_03115, partial [Pirellulaceae bacterium]|nr:hypothetical protein [Pirellulaceae bacterium]
MDRHFDKLIKYYQLLAKKRADKLLSADKNQEIFEMVFGDIEENLDIEWRAYMRSLRTDLERVLDER